MVDKSNLGALSHRFASPEELREAKHQMQKEYKEAVLLMEEMLYTAKNQARIIAKNLDALQANVLNMHRSYDASWLLECVIAIQASKQYASYHAVSVAVLNAIVGENMCKTPWEIEELVQIALVHDIGMAQMPQAVLHGNKTLTEREQEQIRRHPSLSVALLKNSGITGEFVLKGVLHHHERYNGTGYPGKLVGKDIPLEARITAVADTYIAAIARKAYKKQRTPFEILAEFAESPRNELDQEVLKTTVSCLTDLFVGQQAVLSDQTVGFVTKMHDENLAYPVVRVLGRDIQTDENLYAVGIMGRIQMF